MQMLERKITNEGCISMKFSICDCDSGSTIAKAKQKVNVLVKFPYCYTTTWNGEVKTGNAFLIH